VLNLLGQHKESQTSYRTAIGVFEELVVELPDQPDNRHFLAESYHRIGKLLGTLGQIVQQEGTHRYRPFLLQLNLCQHKADNNHLLLPA